MIPSVCERTVRLQLSRAIRAVAAVAAATAATAVAAAPPAAQSSAQPDAILFTDSAGSGTAFFVVQPDGSGRQALAGPTGTVVAQGDWGPGRTRVAFTVLQGEAWALRWRDVPAGTEGAVTSGPEDLEPDWSPDGTRILFTSYFNRGTRDQTSFLMTTSPDGATTRPVIALADPERFIGNPRWAPDGMRIAFTVGSSREGGEIYLTNADGTGTRRLFNHPGWDDIDPAWSPDGTRIAFAAGRYRGGTDATRHDIWLLDVALGVAGTIVVDAAGDLRRPAWSPDGRSLVLDARPTGAPRAIHSLHVVSSTGGTIGTPIATGREADWAPLDTIATATPVVPPSSPTAPGEPTSTAPTSPTPPVPTMPPMPTLPPFPTIPPPGPTDPGPPPTFPPATATPTATVSPTHTATASTTPGPTVSPTTTATPSPTPARTGIYLPIARRGTLAPAW
jgi:hypothetical protein